MFKMTLKIILPNGIKIPESLMTRKENNGLFRNNLGGEENSP